MAVRNRSDQDMARGLKRAGSQQAREIGAHLGRSQKIGQLATGSRSEPT